jgi:hypothetical protein
MIAEKAVFGFRARGAFICIACGAAAGLVSCATPEEAKASFDAHVDVRIGQAFDVLDSPASGVVATPSADGKVHVLALMSADHQLVHVVIGQDGVESREVALERAEREQGILSLPGPYNNLAAGFDAEGTLHVVFREQHLSWRDSRWSLPQKGPPCERLVRAGALLHCLFRETGGELAASMRLQWYFVPPLPVPIPLPQRNTKLLVACRHATGWAPWAVIEPEVDRDVTAFDAVGDHAGSLHLVYLGGSTLSGLGGLVMTAHAPAVDPCDASLAGKPLLAVPGQSSRFVVGRGTISIGTDPQSGHSRVVLASDYGPISFTVSDGVIANKASGFWKRDPLREDFHGVHIRAADGGRFHAMIATSRGDSRYSFYASGEWTPLVQLFDTPPAFLVAAPDGLALVAARSADKKHVVAKWLQVTTK